MARLYFFAIVLFEGVFVDPECVALFSLLRVRQSRTRRLSRPLGAQRFVLVLYSVELLPQIFVRLLSLVEAIGHRPFAVVGGFDRPFEGLHLFALDSFPFVYAIVDLARRSAGAQGQGQQQCTFCSIYHGLDRHQG
jgi:hypothetical protein